MSIFMAAGELARTVGPLFAVWAVSIWSLEGIWRIAVFGWVASLVLFWRFRSVPVQTKRHQPLKAIFSIASRLFFPLFLILLGRSFLLSSIGVYLPTYLERDGATLWFAAGSLSIYEFAGVGGALLSGTLSDRLGRRPVLLVAMLTSAVLMLVLIQLSGWLLIPILIGLGFAGLSAQPVMLAIVQDHLPQHRSTASGFYMGVSFLMRPAAAVVIGALGDYVGLQRAIFWSAIVVLVSVPTVLLLPEPPTSAPGREK
jgi:FSR family fosmidomycin resistance protein-like MFS transporter